MAASYTNNLEQARRLADQGKLRPARSAYKKALAEQPNNTDILIECAVVEAQTGALKSARRMFDKALKINPHDPTIHFNLGEVAREAGAGETALKHYRKAYDLSPGDADILYGYGDALREDGQNEDAMRLLLEASHLAPTDTEIHNALGIAQEACGEQAKAAASYRNAVNRAPDYRDAWSNLGQVLYQLEFFEEAADAFENAQNLNAEPLAGNLIPWAKTLMQLLRYDEVLEKARLAIETNSDIAPGYFTRGMAHQQLGDFDAAEIAFREAISANRNLGEAYEKLALMRRLEPETQPILKSILDNDDVDPSSRAAAGFALYRLHDRDGDRNEAFAALARANAFKAETNVFDRAQHDEMCDQIISVFTRDFFEQRRGQGHDTTVPIFVLGMPRSGTTLTEQILATYPNVNPCGERQDFQELAQRLENYPSALPSYPEDWAKAQGERILNLMLQGNPGARYATNKSPGNYAFIGLIAWLFPNAKIIYCKRDPRDIGLSSFEQNFRSGLSYSYDLVAFAHAYRAHERLMEHWYEFSPIPIYTVAYKELVSDPETAARGMIEYCGLEWHARSLQTEDVERPIGTASVWQVRQPINKGSLDKWKRYEAHLKPMIDALNSSQP